MRFRVHRGQDEEDLRSLVAIRVKKTWGSGSSRPLSSQGVAVALGIVSGAVAQTRRATPSLHSMLRPEVRGPLPMGPEGRDGELRERTKVRREVTGALSPQVLARPWEGELLCLSCRRHLSRLPEVLALGSRRARAWTPGHKRVLIVADGFMPFIAYFRCT